MQGLLRGPRARVSPRSAPRDPKFRGVGWAGFRRVFRLLSAQPSIGLLPLSLLRGRGERARRRGRERSLPCSQQVKSQSLHSLAVGLGQGTNLSGPQFPD